MTMQSRGPSRPIGESIVHAFAELSANLAVTVLGGFLMVAAAHGDDPGLFLVSFGRPTLAHSAPSGYGAPHVFGSVLALVMVGLGLAVLVVGAIGRGQDTVDPALLMDPFPALELS
jgi:hypothetical protein